MCGTVGVTLNTVLNSDLKNNGIYNQYSFMDGLRYFKLTANLKTSTQ